MAPDPVRKEWCQGSSHQYDGFGQGRHGRSSVDSMNVGRAHLSYGTFHPPAYSQGPKSSQSILGYYWYLRLRGHEIDAVDFQRKSFGNTYALQKQTNDARELAKLLMKLCEKTGRRLRRAKYSAQGVHVACVYTDLSYWHIGRKFDVPIYTTRDIYIKALRLLNMSGYKKRVRNFTFHRI